MKIIYKTGNLFEDITATHVIHCTNQQGRMKSGFAKELRERYPGAYTAYETEYSNSGLRLGQIIPYDAEDGRVIFNLVGQKYFGYDGARYVSYDALVRGFETLDELAPQIGMSALAMPLVGCGLAGGRWPIVSSIIETHSTNYQPIVYLLDGNIPQ